MIRLKYKARIRVYHFKIKIQNFKIRVAKKHTLNDVGTMMSATTVEQSPSSSAQIIHNYHLVITQIKNN